MKIWAFFFLFCVFSFSGFTQELFLSDQSNLATGQSSLTSQSLILNTQFFGGDQTTLLSPYQKTSMFNELFIKATDLRDKGMWLTVGGFTAVALGGVAILTSMAVVMSDNPGYSWNRESFLQFFNSNPDIQISGGSLALAFFGYGLVTLGTISIPVGTVLWITGSVRRSSIINADLLQTEY